MASKLKWKKETSYGNVSLTVSGSVDFDGREISVAYIRVFEKGTYCLPDLLFPRNKKSQLQSTKSLPEAKKKFQKKWDSFILSQTKSKPTAPSKEAYLSTIKK